MKNSSQSNIYPKRIRPFPYLVLTLSLLFTGVATYYLAVTNKTKNLERFANSTLQTENAIGDSLNIYMALLRGGASLFAASENVTELEFHDYFERLRTGKFYSSLGGFGFAQRVRMEDRWEMVEGQRRQGKTNFTIWPEGERADYFPIVYLEPKNWRNLRAIGYDMFSEPVRRDAMVQAAKQGLSTSAKVVLVQETEADPQPGFLIYTAVYLKGIFPEDETEREADLVGFVYSPFRAGDFFTGIFRGAHQLVNHLEVYDGPDVIGKNLLHRSQNSIPAQPRFAFTNQMIMGGRTWTMVHRTTPQFEESLERSNVFWVFAVGIVFSFALFVGSLFLARAANKTAQSEWNLLQERERLRASEELHRTIAETAADAIITFDEGSKIITVNQSTERIFGYKQEEMLGQSLTMLMPENMRRRHTDGLARFLSSGERQIPWNGIELPGWHKDGWPIPLEISFGEIRKDGKRIFTGIIRDITERKKVEEEIKLLNRDLERRVLLRTEELQEANEQMEAFVYSIAHDLRAPLRAMRGFAQALREDYDSALDKPGRDYTTRIMSSAKFMDDLINDLLTFSRVTRGELELQPVQMNLILQEAVELLAQEIKDKNAIIEIASALPSVLAHEATLRQIVINLLSNALKFVAPQTVPRIAVEVEDTGENWKFKFTDNGIGISPNYRDRIFGIFERLHGGAYPGTGIGLAIVRKGVERMDGTVGYDSVLGQGSVFWFELPKATP